MNYPTNALSIDPHSSVVNASPSTGTISDWAAKVGWSVWYALQSYGARRALREMRLMGIDLRHDVAPQANDQGVAGQSGAGR